MTANTIAFPGFVVSVKGEWADVTGSLDADEPPFTVAAPKNGVGALQFSPANYKCGSLPEVTIGDLTSMLHEFSAQRNLFDSFDRTTLTGTVFGVAASFHANNNFVRVWYLSDRRSVLLVTYVCDWDKCEVEEDDREEIVRSVVLLP
jgi:hypothetical protein